MKAKYIVSLLLVSLFFNSCSTPKVDTSSDERMKESIQEIMQSLNEDEKKEFKKSLEYLTLSNLNTNDLFKNALIGKEFNIEQTKDNIKKLIDGLTGIEIMTLAKEQMKMQEEKIANAKNKIELDNLQILRDKKSFYDKSKIELTKFKIIESKFYKYKENEYSSYLTPILELKIKNESQYPISKIYCLGTIKSKERSVPWLVEEFNYQISGGLEPNEIETWKLSPNPFSKWGTVDSPEDAIFEVTILAVNDSNNTILYSTKNFSEQEKEQLKKLEEKYK